MASSFWDHRLLGIRLPCACGVAYTVSPTWYWLCKVFLFGFVIPVIAYCIYQLKYPKEAIVLDEDELVFSTMAPWGTSTVAIWDIQDCSFESIPQVHDHLILSVSEACYQREHGSSSRALGRSAQTAPI
ncbi:MAG: hypothetical protein KDB03_01660 [Planctomycetales bacterium]|nr:hypothetical protein [Planctomycetales bacterium]